MARSRPVDFMGKKENEPSMAENWLERTERMLVQMHCTTEEKLECATSLLPDEAYQWWVSVTRTTPLERVVTCALNVERVKKEERERKDKRQGKKNPGQSSSQQQ